MAGITDFKGAKEEKREKFRKGLKCEDNKQKIKGAKTTGKHYKGKKSRRVKAIRNALIAFLAGIGVTIGGTTLAKNLINYKINKDNIKAAEEMAKNYSKATQDPEIEEILSKLQEEDAMFKAQDAAETYKKLKDKPDKTLEESEKYNQACRTLIDSEPMITETYKTIITEKIAKVYGVDSSKVNIKFLQDDSGSYGEYRTVIQILDENGKIKKEVDEYDLTDDIMEGLGKIDFLGLFGHTETGMSPEMAKKIEEIYRKNVYGKTNKEYDEAENAYKKMSDMLNTIKGEFYTTGLGYKGQ